MRYSTGELQALQLIFAVVFGAMDYPYASYMLVQVFEI